MKKYALLALALVAQPALAQDSDAEYKTSGLRIEARLGWETPTVSDGAVYKLGQSVSVGGEVGYDLPVSEKVTVGPYFTYDYASTENCDGLGNCLGSDGNWIAGARVGVNVGAKAQVYAKIGYDQFRLKASIPGASGVETLSGVGGSLGADFNLSRSTYAGFELNYADLGDFAGINFQRRHVAAKVGMRF
jgi:outer membrane immunogenic protein